MKQSRFIVIGIDDSKEPEFGREILAAICGATVFSGGKRHHALVERFLPQGAQWIDITVPLDDVFEKYANVAAAEQVVVNDGRGDVFTTVPGAVATPIIVFASGDPLFFGFAVTLQKRLPHAFIKVYPTFNSLQTLAHKVVLPYDTMRIVSLTGRPWHEFDRALIERADQIGILTDGIHTPAAIALRALDYGYSTYRMFVGECLGGAEEKVGGYWLHEVLKREFASPNCVIMQQICDDMRKGCVAERDDMAEGVSDATVDVATVIRVAADDEFIAGGCGMDDRIAGGRLFGIPDELFMPLNGRVKMITKMPVRLLSLSMLHLYECKSLWDIGFCTGSVSIEAKMQFPHLRIASFEIRGEGLELMQVNSRRFGTPGIDVFIGDFMALELAQIIDSRSENGPILPPDAVFIGGHGGKLVEIVSKIHPMLAVGGRVVFNSVSSQSRNLFMQAIAQTGMEFINSTSITIERYHTIEVMSAQKI
ncbi:MAG: precorrin-6y C5,15-methyltransferase (decarboxylating) subunit CbiE [Bacteroidales bacterium]